MTVDDVGVVLLDRSSLRCSVLLQILDYYNNYLLVSLCHQCYHRSVLSFSVVVSSLAFYYDMLCSMLCSMICSTFIVDFLKNLLISSYYSALR